MPTETLQIFHGDGRTSENPADFLKSFNRAMRQQAITQLNDKLDAYGDYLGTSSQAETWCKALTPTEKATWATFITAFRKTLAASSDRREDESRVRKRIIGPHTIKRRSREENNALR
ncbi:hypothetical protein DFH29DRAFT_1004137 [Suillus ampliporus]|nr:hypothetical protein DFH29DRAFT_1004137 [Suillus ampliporus]